MKGSKLVSFAFTLLLECAVITAMESNELSVRISVSYNPPPGVELGPNEYRAASGPVVVTCTAIGGTGSVSYQWSSDCRNCPFKNSLLNAITRAAVYSRDNGTHTCKAVKGDLEGNASITFIVAGAGIHISNGVPKGSFPNNSLVSLNAMDAKFRLKLLCRSDSMREDVGKLIGLDGNPIVTHSVSFLNVSHPQPGELRVLNEPSSTDLTASEQGVYTCCIPLQSGDTREVNIGIYPSGFTTIPSITNPLVFSPGSSSSTLTCTSTGSVATTVTFMRDGTTVGPLRGGESKVFDEVTYQLTQMVTNRSQSTYQNVLTINQPLADIVGRTFRCSVENTLGTAPYSHPLAITEVSVNISVSYTPPPGFIPGPNEYRAASGPVTVTCTVNGGTGNISYQWSSTCRNCLFKTDTRMKIVRAAVHSGDNGTHTCKAVKGEMEGSASITFVVKGAGIHVFNGVPKGSFPNNSLVSINATDTQFRFRLFCRSDSMMAGVGELIGLDGNPIDSHSNSFFDTSHPIPGELRVVNKSSLTDLPTSEQGVYTCRIPLQSGEIREISIGIYPSGFTTIPSITNPLVFSPGSSSSTLTCTSNGSPATTVTFMRDGTTVGPLREGELKVFDGVTYQLTQTMTNRSQSTYQNVLTINQPLADIVGSTFTCSVENTLGPAPYSHPLAITVLFVNISVSYTPPPGFIPGPNEYRAASGPVNVTCTAIGGTRDVSYQWSSTCRNCPFKTETTRMVERAAVHSGDTGTHTCKAVKGDSEGSASITFIVKGAGIHVFNGVPKGSFPNNSLVSVDATETQFRFRLLCRSDSMREDVGTLIGPDGSPIDSHSNSFFDISHPQPGDLRVANKPSLTVLPAGEQGVYTCRIPLQSGEMKEISIGIYPSGFTTIPTITNPLVFTPGSSSSTLTCTSTGSVATNVTFMRDGTTVGPLRGGESKEVDGVTYQLTQMVTNRSQSTYQNVFTINQPLADIEGSTFTCSVENTIGTAPDSHPLAITVLFISISARGNAVAGESYTLTCTVNLSEGVPDTLMANWSGPGVGMDDVTSGNVSRNGSLFTFDLTFHSLRQSYNGEYNCTAHPTTASSLAKSSVITVTAAAPAVTGVASPMDDSVIAGELFSISCMVTGADSLEARFNFELIAEDNSTVIHHQEDASDTQSIHNFSASASDAGKYVCEVTVHSDFLDAPITSMSTAVTLTVQLTTPVLTLSHDPDGSMTLRHGDPLNLTCTIELNPAVDIDVMVTGTLSGPGIQDPERNVELVRSTVYRIRKTILSLMAAKPAVYTCNATVNPDPSVMYVEASDKNCSMLNINVELFVTISDSYNPPPGVVLGPNEYRAASGPVTVTCTAIGGTAGVSYQWSSTCRNCPFQTATSRRITRPSVNSGDSGTHTCTATSAGITGNTSINITVKDAGIHVFIGIPSGSFPNNGLVSHNTRHRTYRLRFVCHSDSMDENVGELIGLNGSVMHNTSFLEILHSLPGGPEVRNNVSGHTLMPPSEEGIYTCRIPLNNGEVEEINIGIYRSDTATINITSVVFRSESSSSTLTCISTGSPPTTVTWTVKDRQRITMRDGDSETRNGITYHLNQTVIDRKNSTYSNVLNISSASGDILEYACTVRNSWSSDTKHTEVRVTIYAVGFERLGENYSLSCDVTGITGVAVSYTWSGPGMTGNGHDHQLLFLSPLTLAAAGRYTCTATVDSLHLTTSKNVTIAVPAPVVRVSSNASGGVLYAGSILTLNCTITIDEQLMSAGNMVMVTSTWMKDSVMVTSNGQRITTSQAKRTGSTNEYISTLSFNTLRVGDHGKYTCLANISHSSLFTVDGIGMANTTIMITNPTVMLSLTPNTTRLPNVPPYNTFSLTCTATAPDGVISPKTFTWQRRRTGPGSGSAFQMVSNSESTVIEPDIPDSQSVLTVTEEVDGVYVYQCSVRLAELAVTNSTDSTPITVTAFSLFTNISARGSAIAGESYTLTCTITVTEGGPDTLTADWSGDGLLVGMDEVTSDRVFAQTDRRGSAYSIDLTFHSLRQSYNGEYTCTAHLTTVSLTNTSVNTLTVRAPNVTVTITVNPVNGLVIAGKMVSINCMITGADSLEATFDFELVAEDNGAVMHYQEDARDTQVVYSSNARASDAGKYVCKVTVRSDFLDEPITSMSTAVTLTVQTPVVEVIGTAHPIGFITAGETFSITCIVNGANDLDARFNYKVIAEDNGTMIYHQEDASDLQITHDFTARASDAGMYTCEVTVTSTFLNEPITISSTAVTLIVQIATPVLTVSRDPDASVTLRHGDPLNLTCTIKLDPAVDIDVTVSGTLSGPGILNTRDTVGYISSRMYQIKKTVTSLKAARSAVYTCNATVSPAQENTSVRASEKNSSTLNISVELLVTISVSYTPPPGVVLGPNEYRAASGPVTVTCTAIGGTGSVSYQWSSTCRNCPFQTATSGMITRGAVYSGDTGTHTCNATTSANVGSASIKFSVKGAGIHVLNGIPSGSFSNNNLVTLNSMDTVFRLRFFCRSDSMMRNVGELIGLDGSPIVNSSFFEISNPQPGELSVVNFVHNSTNLPASGKGVYTCRIPLQSGETREINIGIYPSGYNNTPAITSVIYRPENEGSKLTCNSINSPPTIISLVSADSVIVTLRDGESVTEAGVMYELMQTLTDRKTSAYTSSLSMTTILKGNITGYRCVVINTMGNDSKPAGEESFSVRIFPSGNASVGEGFTLTCSIAVTKKVVDTLTAHWSGPGVHMEGVTATDLSIQTIGNFSTFTFDLTFTPLRQSHNGDYVCTANLATFTDSYSTELLTIVPLVEVHLSGGGVVEYGESIVLDCAISGANNLEGNIAFQWRGPNRAREESTSTQLTLSTVGFSDAGIYTCTATVSSPYVNENISANDTGSVIISVPPPTVSVALTVDDLLYAGSSLILICTISLDQVPVDVMGITVNSTWTGPHGKLFLEGKQNGRIILTAASKGADGPYRSTLVITPLHMSDTGNYFCDAGVSHMSEFISSDLGTSLIMINVKAPEVTVIGTVSPVNGEGTTGQPYSITCMITGADNLEARFNFTLVAEGNNTELERDEGTRETNFVYNFTARESDAGMYTCKVTVTSTFLNEPIISNTTVTLTLQNTNVNDVTAVIAGCVVGVSLLAVLVIAILVASIIFKRYKHREELAATNHTSLSKCKASKDDLQTSECVAYHHVKHRLDSGTGCSGEQPRATEPAQQNPIYENLRPTTSESPMDHVYKIISRV